MARDEAEPFLSQAVSIHRSQPVILIHDHEPIPDDLQDCGEGGISGKLLAPVLDVKVCEDPMATAGVFSGWAAHARAELEKTIESIRSVGNRALVATLPEDFSRAHREGKVAVLLGSEGGKLIEGSLELLSVFHGMGYRSMQLAWNCPNQILDALDGERSGLTAFGRVLISALNAMGILIDAMHAGKGAFLEIAELSTHPVLLSHGGAHGALRRSRHPESNRGGSRSFVDDEMLRVLAQTGGLLGITFYGPLYHWDRHGSDTFLRDVADHFQYVAEKVGPQVLALGGDFFPCRGAWLHFGPSVSADQFVVPKRGLALLTAHLLARGWSASDVALVLGGNFLRVCERVLRAGSRE